MPVLLYKFSEQTLQPGPSVSLKCIAKGNPPPRIHWTLDGFPVPQSERYVHNKLTFDLGTGSIKVRPFSGLASGVAGWLELASWLVGWRG